MLVLSRKTNERIQIGDNITVTVVRVKGQVVRIGIDAPKDVRILRPEVARAIAAGAKSPAATSNDSAGPKTAEATLPCVQPACAGSAKEPALSIARCEPCAPHAGRMPGASPAPLIRRTQRLGPAVLRSFAGRF